MEDPILNRSLEETRELHTRWSQFRDFVMMAVKQRKTTAQAEMKFLELKSRIAMLHDGFMERLEHEQKTGQNIMSIVADCILLKRCADYSDAEKQKFEFDWNECFLLLTEQLGHLEEQQRKLAAISKRAFNAARRRERMAASVHNFLHSNYLKAVIILAVLFMILWGVPAFGIYDYTNFGKMSWSKPIYRPFVNFVWRPYFNTHLKYQEWKEVRRNEGNDPVGETRGAITLNDTGNSQLTQDYFKERELPWLGLRGEQLENARRVFDSVSHYETERYTAQREDARFYYMLFPEIDQAVEFTTILREGVNAAPAAKQEEVKRDVVLQRRANLVVIGISTHPHRGYAIEEFYIPDTTSLFLRSLSE